jgi:hypothetical protein
MMMYNTWGEGQYVHGIPLAEAAWFVRMVYPWIMPLMFVIAGISARYSLQKRSPKEYIAERLLRVGLPLLTGVLLITPFLSYIADISNNDYSGNYLSHYTVFFTKLTDFSGYDGGFALSHLWFLLYLLIIALAALSVFMLCKRLPKFIAWSKWPVTLIVALGLIQALAENWLNIGGKSLAQYFVLFLIGLFVFSHEEAQAKLERLRFAFLITSLVSGAGYALALQFEWNGVAYSLSYYLYGYMALLALLGFGRRHFNTQNNILAHAAGQSQLYYIIHYPILVAVAFLLMPHITNIPLQIGVFISISFVLTVFLSEIVNRIPVVRVLLGTKPHKRIEGR